MIHQGSTTDDDTESPDEPGSFTWNLATNTLYGDSSVARLYGLDGDAVLAGLPLHAYIDKIHGEDRARVAEAIHSAIVTGGAYSTRFRIVADNMTSITVMACGRCFRDAAGQPSIFSGIVFPTFNHASPDDTLFGQMIAAHRAAVEEGRVDVANALDELMRTLVNKRESGGPHASH